MEFAHYKCCIIITFIFIIIKNKNVIFNRYMAFAIYSFPSD